MIEITKRHNRKNAIEWAKAIMGQTENPPVILDSETTGLNRSDQIIELSMIDTEGEILFDQRFKPTVAVSQGAARVHGLSNDTLAVYPSFSTYYRDVLEIIKGRDLIIYNAEFDLRLLAQTAKATGWEPEPLTAHCAMLHYSAFVGDWNHRFGNYRWQKLPGGDHSALGDCQATLGVIRNMAGRNE